MPTAYFSRVLNNTSWDKLLATSKRQQIQDCKPLNYNILAQVSISSLDFNFLGDSLATPNQCYLKYTSHSIADENGIWNCIIVGCKEDDRKIALYTAGRTFPLYAAPV